MIIKYVVIPFFLLRTVCSYAEPILPVDCVVTPHKVTELSSPVLGVLNRVLVEKSDSVTEGQVVATLESSVEEAGVRLAQARAEIDSEVKEGEVNSRFDYRRQKRLDSLYKQKTVSEDLKDEAEREARLARVRLQQAKDLKNIRQLELEGMKAQLALKTIRSPLSGIVLHRYKTKGEYVEEQPILRIAQLDPLNIEAILPIEAFGKIKEGMQGEVFFDTYKSKPRKAKVVVVDRIGNAASSTFGVRLELDNPRYEIPAGLKCSVRFEE